MAYIGSQQLNISTGSLSPATKKAFNQLILNINNVFMRINKAISSITPLDASEVEILREMANFMIEMHKELKLKTEIPKILMSFASQNNTDNKVSPD